MSSAYATLNWIDGFVMFVAAASVFASFSGSGGALLQPSWSHSAAKSTYDHPSRSSFLPPPPVVADLDGDGTPEVVVATLDGRVMVLSPSDHASADGGWRSLPVRYAASLRSHMGLATGRRPLALQAGALRNDSSTGRSRQVVVVLAEDWTVLAFDGTHQPWARRGLMVTIPGTQCDPCLAGARL